MRTIVDIPEPHIKALDRLARRRGASRAALVREAVEKLIEDAGSTSLPLEATAGLWRNRAVGALRYEDEVRGEWECK